MTIKIRVIRALKEARTRLRDIAAAAHSTAAAHRDQSAQALQDEQDSLEAALDEAADTLATVRSVHDLDRVAESTGGYRLSVADATARHVAATAESDTTANRLRDRTRQLRTAERLVDRVEDRHEKREARAEQRGADDMAARRR